MYEVGAKQVQWQVEQGRAHAFESRGWPAKKTETKVVDWKGKLGPSLENASFCPRE